MPEVRAPWLVRRQPPDRPTQVYATSQGWMRASAGQYWGVGSGSVEIYKSVPAERDAFAVNIRMLDPLVNITAFAGAGTVYGYSSASAEIMLFAREGANRVSQRRRVVSATAPIFWYASDSWPRDNGPDRFEFPLTQPLFFQRPTQGAGQVEVGVRIECYAGSGGFLLHGSSSELTANIPGLTLEWLWRR